jgi:PAS domain S-box-containing protein
MLTESPTPASPDVVEMAMGSAQTRAWALAAVAALAALVAIDVATGSDVALLVLYSIAPLLASLKTSWRVTAATGALAVLAAAVALVLVHDMELANGLVFLISDIAVSALATWGALVRARREAAAARAAVLAEASEALAGPGALDARLRAVEAAAGAIADRCTITLAPPGQAAAGEMVAPLLARGEQLGTLTLSGRRLGPEHRALAAELAERCAAAADSARLVVEADEAYGMLDAVFARAPVGLALADRELRIVRINDHLADINGRPAAEHVGHRVGDLVPHVDGVEAGMRQALETGRAETHAQVAGETEAAPGVRREFEVSYWPVRRRGGDDEILGVGVVVSEVTERLAAERALREQTTRYESLLLALSEVGEAMVVLEDDRLVYANPAFLRISGYSSEQLHALGSVYEIVDEGERADARRRAQLRLEGVSDPGYQVTLRHRDGHPVPMEIAGVPLEVGGRTQMIVVGRDVTARRRAEEEREWLLRRAAFLAEASASFDEVLDEERTVETLARLSVRDLADTCVILLGRSAGSIRRVATVARDPEDERNLRELVERYPFADRRSHPLLEVLATGRSRLVEHGDGPPVPVTDARHRELIDRFTVKSTVLVPLKARGRTLGVMAIGFADVVGSEHVTLFEDLGRRAALALDNARLYGERASVAHTLQRSLLPPVLPDVPEVDIAARYVAAGEGNEVGGDFYDCFPTRGGDWAVVIGDVCGKGAEAAAVTALARYTVRASALLHSDDPRVVLQDLNDAIRREGGAVSRFCTMLYVGLGVRGDRVTAAVASGGHPLPLILRADGRVETAGVPGTLLGILPDPELHVHELDLRAGDSMVLYTDGVIEASPLDDRFGPEQLARCVASCHRRAPVAIARQIEDEVLQVQGGSVRDDVAVLVLRVSPTLGAPFVAERPGVAAST